MKYLKQLSIVLLSSALMACGGGGGNASAPTPVVVSDTADIASILITAVDPNVQSIKADGLTKASYTVRALDANNAVVVGATIKFGASNGMAASPASVTTDKDGTGAVSVIASAADQTNRVGTLTASCSACSAGVSTKTINVAGASLTLSNPSGSNLVVGGASVTLNAVVKNAAGNLMSGVVVSFASTDPLKTVVDTASVTTDALGIASVKVSGVAAGGANINVTAMGAAAAQTYAIGGSTSALTITSPLNDAALNTNVAQIISVSAPNVANVVFVTTLGTFGNNQRSQTAAVNAGVATAVLTVRQAGTATVTVVDDIKRTNSIKLNVSPAVSAVDKILLSVNQTTLPVATGQTTPTVRLKAQAIATVGASDQSVANVPIVFSMSGGPGAGEYLSTSFQFTDSFGYAYAYFYSGASVSIANGISISANIQGVNVKGETVQTGVAPSSNNVALTIGGQALSVAFGAASVLRENTDKTLYMSDYSVIVTDANNNPVPNATVTLRVRPVAFSTGSFCTVSKTYCSEDVNGNGSLDDQEDGNREFVNTIVDAGKCTAKTAPFRKGGTDSLLTPPNSAGGAVPSVVTTGANGTAAFTLTYLKSSSIWIVDQMTATVSSSGTESSGSIVFALAPTETDKVVEDGLVKKCYIPDSPFTD